MSTLQRQLKTLLAAVLVASMLLTGVATGQAAATPCGDGEHHDATVLSAQVGQIEASEITPASDPNLDLAACCSMSGTTCCTSAAIRCEDAIGLGRTPLSPEWLAAAIIALHGLGHEVNRRPPRLA